jgi:hypothetical protein
LPVVPAAATATVAPYASSAHIEKMGEGFFSPMLVCIVIDRMSFYRIDFTVDPVADSTVSLLRVGSLVL